MQIQHETQPLSVHDRCSSQPHCINLSLYSLHVKFNQTAHAELNLHLTQFFPCACLLGSLSPPQNIKPVIFSGKKCRRNILISLMTLQIILSGKRCSWLFNMWHLNKCVHEVSLQLYQMSGTSMNVTAASNSVHTVGGGKHWRISIKRDNAKTRLNV